MARPTKQEVAARPAVAPSFIKNRSDLDRLLKVLNNESTAAVKRLVNIIETSKDEKLVFHCVKAFLEFNLAASEAVERREITRLLAQIKYLHGDMSGSTDDTPLLDFETVVEVT